MYGPYAMSDSFLKTQNMDRRERETEYPEADPDRNGFLSNRLNGSACMVHGQMSTGQMLTRQMVTG